VPEQLLNGPAYIGLSLHTDDKGGFGIWLPSDWEQIKLKPKHHGWLFTPYKDDINTSLLVEKHKLKFKVKADDMPFLRESFHQGVMSLPGAEIESIDENLSDPIFTFDVKFTFMEGEFKRKRWVRTIYWGNGQLVLIAQGRTPEDYEYWLPMFYNSMTTLQII
jgi:hypothetical protein